MRFDKDIYSIQGDNIIESVIYNVRHFGAKGDGITDDTDALRSAFERGGVIYIPQGVYLTRQLKIPSNTKIIGGGIGRTIIKRIVSRDSSGNLQGVFDSDYIPPNGSKGGDVVYDKAFITDSNFSQQVIPI